jgi:sucrose-6-phosphate hydrolase SacC (GH32 family)
MQQWHARPATSIGHSVSTDLLHWRRVPDVLSSGPTGSEQCYDGSSSLVQTEGGVRPFLMIDGGCGHKAAGTSPCMESTGNGSTGGVTATPDDLSDLNLTKWTKQGPTVFHGCNGASGPSPIIKNPSTGKAQIIAIYGRGEALFEATSDLTVWQLRNESFLPARGGGGGLWHELPLNVEGSTGDRKFTHIMQLNNALGDGAATFAMLAVDEPSSQVFSLSPTVALDVGQVRYGQLSNSGGTGADGQTGDLRTIHVAWFVSAGWSTARCLPSDIHVGQLTSFRDLRFEPRIGPSGALVEMPIDEYRALRGGVVGSVAAKVLQPSHNALLALPPGPSAIDIELNFTAAVGSTTISAGCNPGDLTNCGFHLNIAISESTGSSSANVTMHIAGNENMHPPPKSTFPLFANETEFSLRMMTDTRSIEVFAGGGRGVYSGGFSTMYCANATHCSLVASTTAKVDILVTGTAWHMNSIF